MTPDNASRMFHATARKGKHSHERRYGVFRIEGRYAVIVHPARYQEYERQGWVMTSEYNPE